MDFTPCKSMQKDDLEITRNPFDSREFDKENLPAFSPSIFVVSGCRSSEKKNKSFRWSIDQIAALKPAEIDECPNQEYSASYEREEDEIAAQNAINEYFSNVILPSPWTRNSKEHAFKRVTFSPHPPTYFKEAAYESSSSSSANSSQNDGEKKFVDGSCQTTLTIPPNFDLMKLLGDKFYTYVEQEKEPTTKDINVSTLRRKLFSQGEVSPTRNEEDAKDNDGLKARIKSGSTPPRTPRTPNWVTSSPFRDGTPHKGLTSDNDSVLQSSFVCDPLNSPVLSPIKTADDNNNNEYDEDDDIDIAKSFTRLDSSDSSFDFSISSIKNSPLRAEKLVSSDLELSPGDRRGKSVAFHPKSFAVETMSAEPSDSFADIIESTRVAPVEIPGFSPIKREDDMDVSMMSASKFEPHMHYDRNSIKESTANHIHGITGLFSPIKDGRESVRGQSNENDDIWEAADHHGNANDDSVYDDGPLDITDLSLPPELSNGIENHDSQDTTSESDAAFEIVVSSFPTPKRGILKHTSQRDTPIVVNPKNTYENRLENIEEKIGLVENEIEIVKNNCENDIREIKRCLTPAKKLINESQKNKIASFTSQDGKDVAYFNRLSTSLVRPLIDLKRNGFRQPLQDCTNRSTHSDKGTHDRSLQGSDSSKEESIVRNGYFALDRAKRVQRKIDEDFELCFDTRSRDKNSPVFDNNDIESAEVAKILTANTSERLTREGHRIDFIRANSDIRAPMEGKFREYRFRNVRESLNDSWDFKSKRGSDIGEMDSSVFSVSHGDNGTPTPIMNLAGLSIYNAPKDNRTAGTLHKPIPIDRRWIIESGKIERRHTWPNVKPYKAYSGRTVSPTFSSKHRASRGYSFTKQDVVSRLRDEWKLRPNSRTSGYSASR
ncbi:uncharacterized protein LOC135696654 isoform X1 [Rhopilema esculentum]|uniref:uncharacterized protein LOC135696654 isoform X1 n=1 Tax=Rhopilema esculentum TaxID=499914 RepID=UPI0031D092F1